MSDQPGATGKFPDGKLDASDQGELKLKISSDDSLVRLDFGTPIAWFALPKEQAAQLALVLLQHSGTIIDLKMTKPPGGDPS